MPLRVGIGYDVHRKAAHRRLILGGVSFDVPWGLEGHSDADVLSHAIGDALLGAASLGDLGRHFPPGDPRWKDASSLQLLSLIRAMVDGAGASVVNVDATVVAEEPQLSAQAREMCANVAHALRIDRSLVSIKATTHERLGALGRGEGIAAWAVALIETR
ncbi:MAG: 2-C-methyl-D-erythritol 2,4-cyclodiphosphate synthase [Candidatus Eisenbacteria bacterium]|uniref:2-C-methyl-D-erythritol 2,4-cyclodiphosphate synthase n=1 Tax=Eiseniibacteriota bacterium TaxID=2212470 RepID=A0A538TR92_UNCEI|nr:MAG: 2-C-methyl-D-erythritol 2,4-cyclodiphosphate synthase [Candidatus Eisenbacteria bacterium]